MFVNPSLDEVFLINSDDGVIHAASRMSKDCGIDGVHNGHFGILPCDDGERELMLIQFAEEYKELTLCKACFVRELDAERRRKAHADALEAAANRAAESVPEAGDGTTTA